MDWRHVLTRLKTEDLQKNIYIFSGLGADKRAFNKLDLSGVSVTFIEWEVPKRNEAIEDYATRMLQQISTTKPIIMGLSFGGMMAIEVAKQIDTEQIILVASAKSKTEIPFYYRVLGLLSLHKIIPASLLKRSNPLTNWFFGVSSKQDKEILRQILIDTDPIFLKWAIDKIVRWKNQSIIKNLTHIHGTKDRILPLCFVDCNVSIKNGGHLMTINKAEELTTIIEKIL